MPLPRVLLILVEPPLPFGNPASRWFHVLISEMIARGYSFDILVACGVDSDLKKAKIEFKDWSNLYMFPYERSTGFLSKLNTVLYPYKYQYSKAFMAKLTELNPDSYDIIHAEQTWSGWATSKWAHKTALMIHFVLGVDLENVKPNSWRERFLFQRWFAAEKKVISRHPHIIACSPRIQKHIEQWHSDLHNITAIPFGIDLGLYPYIPSDKRQNAKPIVTIVGNMGWSPSLTAAQRLINDLWPAIQKQVPEARLRIVGWGARERLKEYLHLDIEILENVPDTRPYFEEAAVLVYAPGRGTGMKIKILEAMAYGVPVVTTDEGVEGLQVQDMRHVALGSSDGELIEKTVRLLKNTDLQESLRSNARKLIEEQCSPKATVDMVADFHRKILKKNVKC